MIDLTVEIENQLDVDVELENAIDVDVDVSDEIDVEVEIISGSGVVAETFYEITDEDEIEEFD